MHRWVSASDSVDGLGGDEVALLQGAVIRLSGALDYRGEWFVYLTHSGSFVLFLLWSLTYGWMGWMVGWLGIMGRSSCALLLFFHIGGRKNIVFMYGFITETLVHYMYCYHTVSASNGFV